jgi:hypothetical protein
MIGFPEGLRINLGAIVCHCELTSEGCGYAGRGEARKCPALDPRRASSPVSHAPDGRGAPEQQADVWLYSSCRRETSKEEMSANEMDPRLPGHVASIALHARCPDLTTCSGYRVVAGITLSLPAALLRLGQKFSRQAGLTHARSFRTPRRTRLRPNSQSPNLLNSQAVLPNNTMILETKSLTALRLLHPTFDCNASERVSLRSSLDLSVFFGNTLDDQLATLVEQSRRRHIGG